MHPFDFHWWFEWALVLCENSFRFCSRFKLAPLFVIENLFGVCSQLSELPSCHWSSLQLLLAVWARSCLVIEHSFGFCSQLNELLPYHWASVRLLLVVRARSCLNHWAFLRLYSRFEWAPVLLGPELIKLKCPIPLFLCILSNHLCIKLTHTIYF